MPFGTARPRRFHETTQRPQPTHPSPRDAICQSCHHGCRCAAIGGQHNHKSGSCSAQFRAIDISHVRAAAERQTDAARATIIGRGGFCPWCGRSCFLAHLLPVRTAVSRWRRAMELLGEANSGGDHAGVRDAARRRGSGHAPVSRPQVGRFHQGRHDADRDRGGARRRRSDQARRSLRPGASTASICRGSTSGAPSSRRRGSIAPTLPAPISTA